MAYHFFDDETSRTQIIASDSREYIEFLIGVDPETQDIFRAYIALGESVSLRGAELTFGILVTPRNGTEYVIFDGAETGFIPVSDRARILTSLCGAARKLAATTRFARIVMHALKANLPAKASRKYLKICQSFSEEGFTIRERKKLYGIRSWQFSRSLIG